VSGVVPLGDDAVAALRLLKLPGGGGTEAAKPPGGAA